MNADDFVGGHSILALERFIVNSATFFSPIDARSSSSVQVSAAKLSKLDFSSLAAMVIRMDFKVFAEPV